MSFLEVKNIDVAYGRMQVLFDVSLEVDEGEILALVGRNGAGKTTLLKTISGFLKPIKGKIIFRSKDITGISAVKAGQMGIRYVNQEKRVFHDLTVRDNIALAVHKVKPLEQAIKEFVELFPALRKFLDHKAGKLSGGQRQMLLLGMAIISDPSLLLIDEPTEGIAPAIVTDLKSVLKRMKGYKTMIIVEQNLPFCAELADKVYVMKEGRIVRKISKREEIDSINYEKYL